MGFCYSCRFWEASCEEQLDGKCRASCPWMAGIIAPHGNSQFQRPDAAIWPITRRDDWCGHYQPNIELAENREPQKEADDAA